MQSLIVINKGGETDSVKNVHVGKGTSTKCRLRGLRARIVHKKQQSILKFSAKRPVKTRLETKKSHEV